MNRHEGMNDFIRPTLYGAHHEVMTLKEPDNSQALKYDLVGPVCETGDFFAKDINLKKKSNDFNLNSCFICGSFSAINVCTNKVINANVQCVIYFITTYLII